MHCSNFGESVCVFCILYSNINFSIMFYCALCVPDPQHCSIIREHTCHTNQGLAHKLVYKHKLVCFHSTAFCCMFSKLYFLCVLQNAVLSVMLDFCPDPLFVFCVWFDRDCWLLHLCFHPQINQHSCPTSCQTPMLHFTKEWKWFHCINRAGWCDIWWQWCSQKFTPREM